MKSERFLPSASAARSIRVLCFRLARRLMFTSRAARSVECVFGIAISFAARIRYTGMCARCQHKSFGPQSALSLSLQRPARLVPGVDSADHVRSEEHTSELQSLMRNSYAVFCLQQKT